MRTKLSKGLLTALLVLSLLLTGLPALAQDSADITVVSHGAGIPMTGQWSADTTLDSLEAALDALSSMANDTGRTAPAQTTMDPGEVTTSSIPGAVTWAEAMVGLSCWYAPQGCHNEGECFPSSGWCARFVANAYRDCTAGGNAIDLWNEATKYYQPLTSAPVGAIAYWALSSYGHVAIHVGGGYVVEGGYSTVRKVYYTSNSNYQGWFYPPSRWPGRPAPSQTFKTGDSVEITACANVRARPGVYYSKMIDPCQPAGTKGTVGDLSVWADGYHWWKVNWVNGIVGWTAENYLKKATQVNPPTAQTLDADQITCSSARLRGEVTNNGGAQYRVRFRLRVAGGSWTYSGWTDYTTTLGVWTLPLTDFFSSCTTYEFEIQAQNSAGDGWGGIKSFKTGCLELTPSSRDFGEIQVGSCSSTYSFTLKNVGGGTATGSVSLAGTHASQFQITSGGGSFSLGAGATRTISVRFCPTSTGSKSATLRVQGCNEPEAILTGTVSSSPQIELTPSSHNFASIEVGQCSSTYSFTLKNTGGGTATGSVSLTGTHASQFQITSGGGSFSLGAGATKTISVRFCPTSTGGKSATLLAAGSNCNDASSSLAGTGVASPQIELTPSSYNFASIEVGQCSSTYSFTLKNTGGGTATGSVFLTGTHASEFEIPSGGGSFSLGAGATKTISVRFCPTSTGSKSATLYAQGSNCNDASSSLSGNGVAPDPQVELTPWTYDFGDIRVGECSGTYAFTLQNTGGGTATGTVSLIGPDADQFEITSGSGSFSLGTGATKAVSVRFCPTSTGVKGDAYIQVYGSNCNNDASVLYGTGVDDPQDVGAVQVTIEPAGARTDGAQWRLTSGPDTTWKNSGVTVSNLPVGPYTVEFKDIAGWDKPANAPVTINKDQTSTYTGNYDPGLEIQVTRKLPAAVTPGQQFDVVVAWTAPENKFEIVGLSDEAPAGWMVAVDADWCSPKATSSNPPVPWTTELAEYLWFGPYDQGVQFSALYKVQVPPDAKLGTYTWTGGALNYYVDGKGPFTAGITGDDQVTVADTSITGQTAEVNCDTLAGTTVTAYLNGVEKASTVSDNNGNYILALPPDSQPYTVVASRKGFRDETRTIDVPGPGTYTLDFVADHGLVPCAPDMAYVLDCIYLWRYGETPCKLSMNKVLDVIYAWRYPC